MWSLSDTIATKFLHAFNRSDAFFYSLNIHLAVIARQIGQVLLGNIWVFCWLQTMFMDKLPKFHSLLVW